MQEYIDEPMRLASNKDKNILYLLVLLTYIPLTTMGNMIRIAVVGLLYVMKVSNSYVEPGVRKIARYMMISPFVPLVFVFINDGGISTGIVIHEIMRMAYCALIIVVASTLDVDFKCIYTGTLLAFLPNFGIQIAQFLHVPGVTALIRSNYITSDASEFSHLDLSLLTGADFRAGSIYLNPNIFMVIPLLALVVFLQQDYRKRNVINLVLIACTAISLYFCGSRTGIVVLGFILILYSAKYLQGSKKILFVLFVVVAMLLVSRRIDSNARALRLSAEDSGSLIVKFRGFLWYWTSTLSRPIYWLTGSIGASNVVSIDCEWGHLYTWYGIFGIYWYIKYNKLAIKWNENIVFYSKPMTYVCMLCAITASVLLCMPIYSVVVVLLFAKLID